MKNFIKRIRVLLILTIIIFVIFVALGVGGYHYWSRPEFCKSCHIMVPYYDAWKTSTHKDVACVKCHFEPGLENELKGKWLAVKQLASFVTGAYSSKPYAEISDKSCLRSGCHSERLISGKVLYTKRNIQFNHTPHLTEMRSGIRLSCTSCHSQIVIGTHISVTNDTCFLCHFQDKNKLIESDKDKQQNCLLCHNVPDKPITKDGFTINHSSFVGRGISCSNCHIDVTVGSGSVAKDKCFHCHNDTTKIEKFDNKELMHINHITVRKVECDRCHEPIKHKFNTTLIHTQNKDCNTCHKDFHTIQQGFYMGEGAKGITGKPDPMFQVGIGCSACHIVPKTGISINGGVNETLVSNKYTCFACHGKKYKEFPSGFIKSVDEYNMLFEKVVAIITNIVETTKEGDIMSDAKQSLVKIFSSLKFNVSFLKAVRAIHNPFYAVDIIQKCFNDMEDIIKVVKVNENNLKDYSKTKKRFEEHLCNICHKTIPLKEILTLDDKEFPHKKHIEELEIQCTECHKIDKEDTLSNQHPPKVKGKEVCTSCHE